MKKFIHSVFLILLAFSLLSSSACFAQSADDIMTTEFTRATAESGAVTISNSCCQLYDQHIQIFAYGYVEYKVTVPSAARYSFLLHYGTNTEGVIVDISVNDTVQIENCNTENTSSYYATTDKILGTVDLRKGENTIRIDAVDNPDNDTNEWLLFSSATLTKTEDIVEGVTFPINSSNADITVINNGSSNAGLYDGYMIMRSSVSGPSYISVPFTPETSGWYGISATVGTSENGFILSAVADGQAIKQSFESTGGYSKYVEKYMDAIYFEAGKTTEIKIAAVGGVAAAFVKEINLDYLKDFSKTDFTIPVNKCSILSYDGGNSNGGFGNDAQYYIVMQGNSDEKTWFEAKIHIDIPGYYNITASAGTSDSNFRLTASSGESSVSAKIDSTGAYTAFSYADIGALYLEKGTHTIKLDVTSNAGFINELKIAKEAVYDFVIPVNADNTNITNYNSGESNGGFDTYNNCMVMRGNGSNKTWFEVPVYVDIEGWYKTTVLIGTTEVGYTLSLTTGDEVLTNEVAVTNGYTKFEDRVLGTIYLTEGLHTLRLTATAQAGLVKQLTLSCMEDYAATELIDFQIVSEDDARIPYNFREGFDVYAKASVKQIGTTTDTKKLIIAEYSSDGKLIDVKTGDINLSEIASGETKDFKIRLTLSGEGNLVKGFLMEDDSITPVCNATSHKEAVIFTDEAIAGIKSAEIGYTKATELTNSTGANYLDTGLYTNDYNITPVFYDGYNGSKIFAYIGIPSGATAENPVPAVVCVHGGAGQAYRSWVEQWNKRGFAAISMDMYGKAPEGEYSYTYNGVRSPYAGDLSEPWNNGAFVQDGDYRKGAMYQNVVNVMYAHNLLRSFEEIDSSKIGITGVSWGGITTTTTIGVDDRFIFAAPIYGCGYLDSGNTYFASASYFGTEGAIYWDPANFAAKANLPVMYLNGNNDVHFSVKASSLTYGVTENAYLSFHNGLSHSQVVAESVEQAYSFAQNIVNGTNPYIKVNGLSIDGEALTVDLTIPEGTTLEGATMYYLTDKEFPSIANEGDLKWSTFNEYSIVGNNVTMNIPTEVTHLYVEFKDGNENIICSKFVKVK